MMQETQLAPQQVEHETIAHETIERKARHFVRWNPTTTDRLDQLAEMADWASHFNPSWKVKKMIPNAKKLFATLQKYQARYLVIGGFAAITYGVPRFTSDVDIFVEGSEENIQRVIDTLIKLGSEQAVVFRSLHSTLITLMEFDDLPVKTDVMVKVPGLEWEAAWEHRQKQVYQKQEFYTVSRDDLIKAKRAAGRWQDLEDIKALEATKP